MLLKVVKNRFQCNYCKLFLVDIIILVIEHKPGVFFVPKTLSCIPIVSLYLCFKEKRFFFNFEGFLLIFEGSNVLTTHPLPSPPSKSQ